MSVLYFCGSFACYFSLFYRELLGAPGQLFVYDYEYL